MPQKINISEKGKTYHLELDSEFFVGKKIGEKVKGEDFSTELEGYELEITGASDRAGFPAFKELEGEGLTKILLTYGKGFKKKPRKEGKKKRSKNMPKGLRMKKTVHRNTLTKNIHQINMKVLKAGTKKLEDIFPGQAQPKTKWKQQAEQAEAKTESPSAGQPKAEAAA